MMSQFTDSPVISDQLHLSISECFIYKIPSLRSATGHRAEEWDLANPLVTGCLRIYQASDESRLRIVLYSIINEGSSNRTDDNIRLFGECSVPGVPDKCTELETKPTRLSERIHIYVDSVVDSSRYYVLKLINPSDMKKVVFIGIGFREREMSFDFRTVINQFVKSVDRHAGYSGYEEGNILPAPDGIEEDDSSSATDSTPVSHGDHALKEGEKIVVKSNFMNKLKKTGKNSKLSSISSKTGTMCLLPPPTANKIPLLAKPASKPDPVPVPSSSMNNQEDIDDFDDFTDFVSA